MISQLLLALMLTGTADATVYCGEEVGHRAAPCKPSREERDAVLDKIKAALELEGKWRSAQQEEVDQREAMALLLRQHRNPPPKMLTDWKESSDRLTDLEGEMRQAFSEVMKATQESYGVGPQKRVGKVKGGHLDGEPAFWAPIVEEADDFVYRAGPKENPAYLRWQAAAGDGTDTLDDGTVFVSLELLRVAKKQGSPAVLAAAIDREAERFEQLTSKNGWSGADSVKYRAYRRQEETGSAIDLDDAEMRRVAKLRQKYADLASPRELWPGYRAGPTSNDYPYRRDIELDGNSDVWKNAQKNLAAIREQREDFNTRLAARHEGNPEDGMSDGLNEGRPPCGGQGLWAGDVYFPSLPCEGTVRPSPEPVPVTVARPDPPPVAVVPAYLLTALADRICSDPSSANSEANHFSYQHGVVLSGETGDALPPCQREVYLNLRRIQREGDRDYDSQFFQSLAERFRNPSNPDQTDDPGRRPPPGPRVPDCILQPGGRCIRRN